MIYILAFLGHFSNFERLKRLTHIFLIGIYLFCSTELKELVKLPVLFQHFFEHKELDQQMTFLGYLEHHYSDVPHTDNDADRDNQLPFKTNDLFAGNVLSPAVAPHFAIQIKKTSQLIVVQKIRVNNDYVDVLAYTGKIWQPPKSFTIS